MGVYIAVDICDCNTIAEIYDILVSWGYDSSMYSYTQILELQAKSKNMLNREVS